MLMNLKREKTVFRLILPYGSGKPDTLRFSEGGGNDDWNTIFF